MFIHLNMIQVKLISYFNPSRNMALFSWIRETANQNKELNNVDSSVNAAHPRTHWRYHQSQNKQGIYNKIIIL